MANDITLGVKIAVSETGAENLSSLDTSLAQTGVSAHEASKGLGAFGQYAVQLNNAVGLVSQVSGYGSQLVDYGKKVIELSDNYRQLQARIGVATGSMEQSAAVMSQVADIAARTHAPLEATAELFSRLATVTKQAGISQSEMLTFSEGINNALSVSGTKSQEAAGALTQLAQAMGAGALRGEEFNSVNEQMPVVLDAVAAYLGKTRGELKKMAEDGVLTSKTVLYAVNEMGAAWEKQAAALPLTMGKAITDLNTAFQRYVGENETVKNISGDVASTLGFVAKHLDDITMAAKAFAQTGMELAMIGIIKSTMAWVESSRLAVIAQQQEAQAAQFSALKKMDDAAAATALAKATDDLAIAKANAARVAMEDAAQSVSSARVRLDEAIANKDLSASMLTAASDRQAYTAAVRQGVIGQLDYAKETLASASVTRAEGAELLRTAEAMGVFSEAARKGALDSLKNADALTNQAVVLKNLTIAEEEEVRAAIAQAEAAKVSALAKTEDAKLMAVNTQAAIDEAAAKNALAASLEKVALAAKTEGVAAAENAAINNNNTTATIELTAAEKALADAEVKAIAAKKALTLAEEQHAAAAIRTTEAETVATGSSAKMVAINNELAATIRASSLTIEQKAAALSQLGVVEAEVTGASTLAAQADQRLIVLKTELAAAIRNSTLSAEQQAAALAALAAVENGTTAATGRLKVAMDLLKGSLGFIAVAGALFAAQWVYAKVTEDDAKNSTEGLTEALKKQGDVLDNLSKIQLQDRLNKQNALIEKDLEEIASIDKKRDKLKLQIADYEESIKVLGRTAHDTQALAKITHDLTAADAEYETKSKELTNALDARNATQAAIGKTTIDYSHAAAEANKAEVAAFAAYGETEKQLSKNTAVVESQTKAKMAEIGAQKQYAELIPDAIVKSQEMAKLGELEATASTALAKAKTDEATQARALLEAMKEAAQAAKDESKATTDAIKDGETHVKTLEAEATQAKEAAKSAQFHAEALKLASEVLKDNSGKVEEYRKKLQDSNLTEGEKIKLHALLKDAIEDYSKAQKEETDLLKTEDALKAKLYQTDTDALKIKYQLLQQEGDTATAANVAIEIHKREIQAADDAAAAAKREYDAMVKSAEAEKDTIQQMALSTEEKARKIKGIDLVVAAQANEVKSLEQTAAGLHKETGVTGESADVLKRKTQATGENVTITQQATTITEKHNAIDLKSLEAKRDLLTSQGKTKEAATTQLQIDQQIVKSSEDKLASARSELGAAKEKAAADIADIESSKLSREEKDQQIAKIKQKLEAQRLDVVALADQTEATKKQAQADQDGARAKKMRADAAAEEKARLEANREVDKQLVTQTAALREEYIKLGGAAEYWDQYLNKWESVGFKWVQKGATAFQELKASIEQNNAATDKLVKNTEDGTVTVNELALAEAKLASMAYAANEKLKDTELGKSYEKLKTAIDSAKDSLKALHDEATSALQSSQDALDGINNNQAGIENRRWQNLLEDLTDKWKEAQKAGASAEAEMYKQAIENQRKVHEDKIQKINDALYTQIQANSTIFNTVSASDRVVTDNRLKSIDTIAQYDISANEAVANKKIGLSRELNSVLSDLDRQRIYGIKPIEEARARDTNEINKGLKREEALLDFDANKKKQELTDSYKSKIDEAAKKSKQAQYAMEKQLLLAQLDLEEAENKKKEAAKEAAGARQAKIDHDAAIAKAAIDAKIENQKRIAIDAYRQEQERAEMTSVEYILKAKLQAVDTVAKMQSQKDIEQHTTKMSMLAQQRIAAVAVALASSNAYAQNGAGGIISQLQSSRLSSTGIQ